MSGVSIGYTELTVIGCRPNQSLPASNVTIIVEGTGFTPVFYAYIKTEKGNFYPTSQQFILPEQEIQFTIDLRNCPVGSHKIVVENSRNEKVESEGYIFELVEYIDSNLLPTVISVSPSSIYNNGMSTVQVLGNNLNNVNRAVLGNLESTNIENINANTLTIVFDLSYLSPNLYDLKLYVNDEFKTYTPFPVKAIQARIDSISHIVNAPDPLQIVSEQFTTSVKTDTLIFINGFGFVENFELVFSNLQGEKIYPVESDYLSYVQLRCMVVFQKPGLYTITYTNLLDDTASKFNGLILVVAESPEIKQIRLPYEGTIARHKERLKIEFNGSGFKPGIKVLPHINRNFIVHSTTYISDSRFTAEISFLVQTEIIYNLKGNLTYNLETLQIKNPDGGKTNYKIRVGTLKPEVYYNLRKVFPNTIPIEFTFVVVNAYKPVFILKNKDHVNLGVVIQDPKINNVMDDYNYVVKSTTYLVQFKLMGSGIFDLIVQNQDGNSQTLQSAFKIYDWDKGFPDRLTPLPDSDKIERIDPIHIRIADFDSRFVLPVFKTLENYYYITYSMGSEPIANNTIVIRKTDSVYTDGYIGNLTKMFYTSIDLFLNQAEYDFKIQHILAHRAIHRLHKIPESFWDDVGFDLYLSHVKYADLNDYLGDKTKYKNNSDIQELYLDYCEKRYFFT
jgi:hypothetical protein